MKVSHRELGCEDKRWLELLQENVHGQTSIN